MNKRRFKTSSFAIFFFALLLGCILFTLTTKKSWSGQPWEIQDIANTKHNLSSIGSSSRTVKSTDINAICVFCHTPHASEGDGPLWNRKFSASSYSMYQPQININAPGTVGVQSFKGSLDSTVSTSPTGYSKLCLSCHDGSIAINTVLNKPGAGGYNAGGSLMGTLTGTGPGGVMPEGSGEFTGDTRRLGADLSNDHPVSFRMDQQTVIDIDKELSKPDDCAKNNYHYGCNEPNWGRKQGVRLYPLNFSTPFKDAVQCTSCHNPHTTNEKFLRANKFNLTPGTPTNRTQICEACHPKPGWVGSTHENAFFGFKYRDSPEAPELDGKTVAQHGCINCHDPHTIQGADRLHRNGAGKPGDTYGANNANVAAKTPAIENTCYQCHIDKNASVPNLGTTTNFLDGSLGAMFYAPDIKTVFDKNTNSPASGYKEMESGGSSMPLDRSWMAPNPGDTNGIHQPVFVSEETIINRLDFHGSDNTEENVLNRPKADEFIHVECVDCHNPHQVDTKNRMKGMKGIRLDGTIIGGDTGVQPIASMPGTANGPLGGSVLPFTDDRGPGNTRGAPKRNGTATVDQLTLRYEPLVYEICLRCHGDSFSHNMPFKAYGAVPSTGGPSRSERNRGHKLAPMVGGSQFGSSNKRLEFDPSSHGRSWTATGGFNDSLFSYNPAYHPVSAPGRNGTVALYNQLRISFNLGPSYLTDTAGNRTIAAAALSTLTIQCTDCHNSSDMSASNLNFTSPNGPIGPITGIPDNPAVGMYSYRRSTDREAATLNNTFGTALPYTINPSRAQGPHGSANPRILRAPYRTQLRSTRGSSTISSTGAIYNNFGLCFQCHEEKIFLNDTGFSNGKGTNFGADARIIGSGFTGGRFAWNNNLHFYHLTYTGAFCHECHNNLHSNIEADNTIYGDGLGGYLPDDAHDGIDDGYADTHLINFGPQASGDNSPLPNWYYDPGLGQFRCNLVCHGITMTSCAYYTHSNSFQGGGRGSNWNCGAPGHGPPF